MALNRFIFCFSLRLYIHSTVIHFRRATDLFFVFTAGFFCDFDRAAAGTAPPALITRIDQYSHERVNPVV
jgi:hypothetical protein